MEETDILQSSESLANEPRTVGRTVLLLVILIGIALIVLGYNFALTPANFDAKTVKIPHGASTSEIVNILADEKIVRSSDYLYLVLALFHKPADIKAGSFAFNNPLSVFEVAEYITSVTPKDDLLKITFPEGLSIKKFADIAQATLPNFDKQSFFAKTVGLEGYLFPETYFVPTTYTEDDLIKLMRNTYDTEMLQLEEPLRSHALLSKDEIIILASIIEREARSGESMKIVSGILQNRLAINMPLQADATMEYVLDKPLSELQPNDLELDSPYNTYKNYGLPPTAIGNPGLTSIQAVLWPTKTAYFYYITDVDGVFHYAKTFAEHKANIARYLR